MGCEYGRTNRIFIKEIQVSLNKIEANTNRFSKRLPEWALIIIATLTAIIGFVVGIKL